MHSTIRRTANVLTFELPCTGAADAVLDFGTDFWRSSRKTKPEAGSQGARVPEHVPRISLNAAALHVTYSAPCSVSPYNHPVSAVSLIAGTRLGPYEITAQIGVGGMGEVYRATDTNLKRQVAIKVLPEAVAADAERLARFQREAEVLASLNHPNIAIIHGLEKSDGVTGLVMELVEGPTLADRIAQGPIPIDEALPIAKQIAEALEARARAGHHSSRPEARQHQGADGRHGEGAGLRAGESDGTDRHVVAERLAVTDDHDACDDADGTNPRHCGLHEPRAGQGFSGRSPIGRLGVRCSPLRDAGWTEAFRRRDRQRHSGTGYSNASPISPGFPPTRQGRSDSSSGDVLPRIARSGCSTSAMPESKSPRR